MTVVVALVLENRVMVSMMVVLVSMVLVLAVVEAVVVDDGQRKPFVWLSDKFALCNTIQSLLTSLSL